MTTNVHPIRFRIEQPARMERIHVLIRLLLLVALGALSWSSLYWALYVGLPAYAALLISQNGAGRFLEEDAPRLTRVIRWVAAASAYLWLLTDEFPTTAAARTVELEIHAAGKPDARSALLRLLYSLPALVLAVLLSFAAGFLWVIGAVAILVRQRVPGAVADFLTAILCYRIRLLGYHLSVVDRYPTFDESQAASELQALGH